MELIKNTTIVFLKTLQGQRSITLPLNPGATASLRFRESEFEPGEVFIELRFSGPSASVDGVLSQKPYGGLLQRSGGPAIDVWL